MCILRRARAHCEAACARRTRKVLRRGAKHSTQQQPGAILSAAFVLAPFFPAPQVVTVDRVVEVPVDRVVEVQTEKILTKEVPVTVVQDRVVTVRNGPWMDQTIFHMPARHRAVLPSWAKLTDPRSLNRLDTLESENLKPVVMHQLRVEGNGGEVFVLSSGRQNRPTATDSGSACRKGGHSGEIHRGALTVFVFCGVIRFQNLLEFARDFTGACGSVGRKNC